MVTKNTLGGAKRLEVSSVKIFGVPSKKPSLKKATVSKKPTESQYSFFGEG